MKDKNAGLIFAVVLIALGVLFLLQNFGIIGDLSATIWMVLFGVGGLIFLYVFATNQEQWWAIIPGFTLLGLAALIGLGDRLGDFAPALFLGSIGLSFGIIYFIRREFWWAIIPCGTLLSIAVMIAITPALGNDAAAPGIMFLGLALTFCMVYLLPREEHLTWALIPAGVLAIIGIMLILSLGGMINYVWPLVLIVAGGLILLRAVRSRA